jgi:hypothetical protein
MWALNLHTRFIDHECSRSSELALKNVFILSLKKNVAIFVPIIVISEISLWCAGEKPTLD